MVDKLLLVINPRYGRIGNKKKKVFMVSRKLFCEISPLTYRISVAKGIFIRKLQWMKNRGIYSYKRESKPLQSLIYKHKSLIRRALGNVDMTLQENKAVNLSLAAPLVNGILIKPGEIFSFWRLVGNCTQKKGYLEGLVIKSGGSGRGIGGGLCQFTNLIHWMVLHSPLEIIEHHHHNNDLFPDFGRQIPFGTGTSIMYNYLDYQFINNTNMTFQLITFTDGEYFCGELRCNEPLQYSYHIREEEHHFSRLANDYFRNNEIYRDTIDKITGNVIKQDLIIRNHSRVAYDKEYIPMELIW